MSNYQEQRKKFWAVVGTLDEAQKNDILSFVRACESDGFRQGRQAYHDRDRFTTYGQIAIGALAASVIAFVMADSLWVGKTRQIDENVECYEELNELQESCLTCLLKEVEDEQE